MIIRVKTAHGYLSFQPDGRIEYRESAGPWEEIDLVGFEFPVPPATECRYVEPPVTPPVEPPVVAGIPAAVQPVERTAAYIGRVKSYLQGQGMNLSGPCGAFAIVKHASWYLRPSNPTVGLLDKPAGNNCEGYSTDIIMFSDMNGQIIDVLGDGGGANNPQWGVSDVVDPARWRPPVRP